MIPDAECIRVISEVLTDLKLGKFVVKVSEDTQFWILTFASGFSG